MPVRGAVLHTEGGLGRALAALLTGTARRQAAARRGRGHSDHGAESGPILSEALSLSHIGFMSLQTLALVSACSIPVSVTANQTKKPVTYRFTKGMSRELCLPA